jgi:hypothetical protein
VVLVGNDVCTAKVDVGGVVVGSSDGIGVVQLVTSHKISEIFVRLKSIVDIILSFKISVLF